MGQLSGTVSALRPRAIMVRKGVVSQLKMGRQEDSGVFLNQQLFTFPREEFTSDARRAGLGGRKCSGGVGEATGLCGLQLGPRHVHFPGVCT